MHSFAQSIISCGWWTMADFRSPNRLNFFLHLLSKGKLHLINLSSTPNWSFFSHKIYFLSHRNDFFTHIFMIIDTLNNMKSEFWFRIQKAFTIGCTMYIPAAGSTCRRLQTCPPNWIIAGFIYKNIYNSYVISWLFCLGQFSFSSDALCFRPSKQNPI